MAEAPASVPSFAEKNALRVCTAGLTIVILAAAVAAVSGPLYQAGILGLQVAFDVLRIAVQWGLAAGASLCLAGVVLSIIAYNGDFISSSPAGVLGLIVAAAVAYVPLSQVMRGAPPIHEVTTDFENPPAFVDIVPLRVATNAANPPGYVPLIKGFGREVDVIAEQKDHYPDIAPVRFENTNYEEVYDKALKAVEEMGWTLVSANPQTGRIEAYDTTAWFGFIDDVIIRVEAQPMEYEIDIRSKSRVGFGDVGANAKRVREYLRKVSGRPAH